MNAHPKWLDPPTYVLEDMPDVPQQQIHIPHADWPFCACCGRIVEVRSDDPPAFYVIEYDVDRGVPCRVPVYRIVVWIRDSL